jgi:hypothetical protein
LIRDGFHKGHGLPKKKKKKSVLQSTDLAESCSNLLSFFVSEVRKVLIAHAAREEGPDFFGDVRFQGHAREAAGAGEREFKTAS